MFHAVDRLPHLLSPDAYWSNNDFSWEMQHVFSRAWHFVGLTSELSQPGNFLTTEICGHPIQVRNIAGTICAVSNVCAHRHCLLTSEKKGTSPKLRCQYHGWEYDALGATQRIPQAQHFAPLDRTSAKISAFRVETVGPLVFVNLDAVAPNLETFLGGSLEMIRQGFGDGWEVMLNREFPQPVNWKIPVENSLEAYHVPAVHPDTFRADPGEERSEHILGERGSSFETTLPFAPHSKADEWFQGMEGRVLKMLLGSRPTARYQQHHVFPNLLFSFTDMVSFLHVVRPTGPQACVSVVYQFGRVGKSYFSQKCCRLWGRLAANVTLKILKEDFQLYPDIQRGLVSSQNLGMLGRCEERIHLFQKWLTDQRSQTPEESAKTTYNSSTSCDCNGSSLLYGGLAPSIDL